MSRVQFVLGHVKSQFAVQMEECGRLATCLALIANFISLENKCIIFRRDFTFLEIYYVKMLAKSFTVIRFLLRRSRFV